jgi:hypothetical protein
MSILKVKQKAEKYDFEKDGNFDEAQFGSLSIDDFGRLYPFSLKVATQNVTALSLVKIDRINDLWQESTITNLTSEISSLMSSDSDFIFTTSNTISGSHTIESGFYSIHFTNNSIDYKTEIFSVSRTVITPFISLVTNQSLFQTVGIKINHTGIVKVDWGDSTPFETFVSGVELTHDYSSGTPQDYTIKIEGAIANITDIYFDNSKIKNIVNFAALTGINGIVRTSNNSELTGITNLIGIIDNFDSRSCNLTGTLDFSNVASSENCLLNDNPLLTNVTFASSGNAKGAFWAYNCNLTGTLNLLNRPLAEGTGNLGLRTYNNSLLTAITLSTSGNDECYIDIGDTAVTSLDFQGFATFTSKKIYMDNNNMSIAQMDAQLSHFVAQSFGAGTASLFIGGNNAIPTGAGANADYLSLLADGWTISINLS